MEQSLESDNATRDADKRDAETCQDDNRVIMNNNANTAPAPVDNLHLGSSGGSSVESEVSSEEVTPSSNAEEVAPSSNTTEDNVDVLQENIEKQNNLVNVSEAVPDIKPANDEVSLFSEAVKV